MPTTQVSPLPIVLGEPRMVPFGCKSKKKTNRGTKQCGTCLEGGKVRFAKNNKQVNCHHCAKKGLVTNNWLKKKKATNNGGQGKQCPNEDCGAFTKGNRAHNCKKCGAEFPAKSKSKAYILTGKRKNRSSESAIQKKKKKKKEVGPTLSPRIVTMMDSPLVHTPVNEPHGENAAFDIDLDTFLDEIAADSQGENTPTGDYYLAPGFENSKDQGKPGPPELTRGNSLTPIPALSGTADVPDNAGSVDGLFELSSGLFDAPAKFARGNSLSLSGSVASNAFEPITFDYSDHELPDAAFSQNVYENEEQAFSDFSTFFNSPEITV